MSAYPDPMDRCIRVLSRLPGLGRRSAERMALKLAQNPGGLLDDVKLALTELKEQIATCTSCGALTEKNQDPCRWCTDPKRESRILCVVESTSDLLLLERSGGFKGRYFCLNARLSPMRGEGPADVPTGKLLQKISDGSVEEVILALNADVESDATAAYLVDVLKSRSVRVTRLALGLPAGSGIAYADDITLSRALEGRTPIR